MLANWIMASGLLLDILGIVMIWKHVSVRPYDEETAMDLCVEPPTKDLRFIIKPMGLKPAYRGEWELRIRLDLALRGGYLLIFGLVLQFLASLYPAFESRLSQLLLQLQ